MIRELSAGALAISALGLVEAMSIARSISAQSGERIEQHTRPHQPGTLRNFKHGFTNIVFYKP